MDTAISTDKKRRKHKTHVVFDGNRVFRVKRLTELENAAMIFLGSLFLQNYEEVMELIKENIKVFLLKNTKLLEKLREENAD